jgi:putative membrane protein
VATSWIWGWSADPAVLVPLTVAWFGYGAAVRRVAARGRPHQASRVLAFRAGLVVTFVALASPIDAEAARWLSWHMVQHLLLTFVAAPLLVLGAPLAVALRAAGPPARRRAVAVMHGLGADVLARPVVAWTVFTAGMFAIHLSPLYQASLEHAPLHALEHVLFVAIGVVFFEPVIGGDPVHRSSPPGRMLYLALAAPPQVFLALAIVAARRPLYEYYDGLPSPWGPAALVDQAAAGVVMWFVGGVILTGALLAAAVAWRRAELSRQIAAERKQGRHPRGLPDASAG